MPRVTACVLTKNEEENLPACLESLRWADAIQVLDSGSTDKTLDIARAFGAEILTRPWSGFYDQRVHQFAQPKTDWLFWLDADERVTPALEAELRAWKARQDVDNPTSVKGYTVPRLSHFLGDPVRHCGWYPDRMPRLFRKDAWSFNREGIHAKIVVDGGCGALTHDIEHHPYRDLATYYRKIADYACETAEYKFKEGKRCGLAAALAQFPLQFVKMYVFQGGVLDGRAGLMVSWIGGMSQSMKYLELYRRTASEARGGTSARATPKIS
jgi:(heptosyl)LPS beta-1,4-glucosyltransferase